jgi:NAD(P)-dependent dehydrogenase (short-subunit alcohol dehydrogenase family)
MPGKGSDSMLCALLHSSEFAFFFIQLGKKRKVSPDFSFLIDTSMLIVTLSTPLLQDWLGDDAAKRLRREVHFPSGRFGEAIEQAHAVVFLASDESSFVNGTDFVVDGGMTKVSFHDGH